MPVDEEPLQNLARPQEAARAVRRFSEDPLLKVIDALPVQLPPTRFVTSLSAITFKQKEAIRRLDPTAKYPICMEGQLACPPEDCGGIPGFYDLVEAIADPNHEQHEELKDWLGYDFDPMDFSIDSVLYGSSFFSSPL